MAKGSGGGGGVKKEKGRNSDRPNGKAWKKRPKKQDVNLNPSAEVLAKRARVKRDRAIIGLHEADDVDARMRRGR